MAVEEDDWQNSAAGHRPRARAYRQGSRFLMPQFTEVKGTAKVRLAIIRGDFFLIRSASFKKVDTLIYFFLKKEKNRRSRNHLSGSGSNLKLAGAASRFALVKPGGRLKKIFPFSSITALFP